MASKMRVYIAGPMRITKRDDLNEPEFRKYQAIFDGLGWKVVVPHDIDKAKGAIPEGLTYDQETIEYFDRDRPFMLGCDAIFFMKGWHKSDGCACEYQFARDQGMRMIFADDAITGVIGFAGPAQSGKTTSANFILHQNHINRMKLAYPLYGACRELGISKEDHNELFREVTGYLGAKLRAEDPDWLVKRASKFLDTRSKLVVFDDIRDHNEIEMIRKACGIVLFVDAEGRKDFSDPLYDTPTERLAMDWYADKWMADGIVLNSGPAEMQQRSVNLAIEGYLERRELLSNLLLA